DDVTAVAPDKPWFCYLPFGAVHAPLHVPEDYRDRYRGEFDDGWNALRERTLARQKELGAVPADTALAPFPSDCRRGTTWTTTTRRWPPGSWSCTRASSSTPTTSWAGSSTTSPTPAGSRTR